MKNKNTILDKQIFKEGIGKLAHVYPSWEFDYKNKESMATMYSFFKEMDADRFEEMIQNHILKERYNPTIASLNEYRKPNKLKDKRKIRYING